MIWFACKGCGKVHGRPDEQGSTLVFCECGQSNRVPWESTAFPPADEAPRPFEAPPTEPRRSAEPLPSRRPMVRRRDPAYCFNHPSAPTEHACAACGEAFCASCVVPLHGQILCGPCKNFRINSMTRPPTVAPLALVALGLGVISAPATWFLSILPASTDAAIGGVIAGAGMLFALITLVVGLLALRQIEGDPRVGGLALALTGTGAGVIGVLQCLTVVLMLIARGLLG